MVPCRSFLLSGRYIQQQAGIEVIQHYACRDRNLLGMQADLLGAYALGLRNLLLVTALSGTERTDTLIDIEWLQFADQLVLADDQTVATRNAISIMQNNAALGLVLVLVVACGPTQAPPTEAPATQ